MSPLIFRLMFKLVAVAAAYQIVKLPFGPGRGLSSGSEYNSLFSAQSPALRRISDWFTGEKMTPANLDLLTLTAADLKTLLEDGAVSSVDLFELYLAQIDKHNHNGAKLHAVISTAPRVIVMELARQLDDERAKNKLRGPLHGVPIVIKVLLTHQATYRRD